MGFGSKILYVLIVVVVAFVVVIGIVNFTIINVENKKEKRQQIRKFNQHEILIGSLNALDDEEGSHMEIFQDKHNAFIDAIFTRINKILSDSYDPLNVRLSGRSKHFKGKSNDGKHQR